MVESFISVFHCHHFPFLTKCIFWDLIPEAFFTFNSTTGDLPFEEETSLWETMLPSLILCIMPLPSIDVGLPHPEFQDSRIRAARWAEALDPSCRRGTFFRKEKAIWQIRCIRIALSEGWTGISHAGKLRIYDFPASFCLPSLSSVNRACLPCLGTLP